MSCTDYVLYRVCFRKNCRFVHDFLYCNPDKNRRCEKSLCRRFHLLPEEMGDLRNNIRPFNQNVIKEVDRIAYVIKSSLPISRKTKYCCRLFTGLNHCRPKHECTTCEQMDNWVNYQASTILRCKYCYYPNITHRLRCNHVYHYRCFKHLELNIEGALPLFKCLLCRKFVVAMEMPVYLTPTSNSTW